MDNLKRLSEEASAGTWAYRPDAGDDWGAIRVLSKGKIFKGRGRMVAVSRPCDPQVDLNKHRRNHTDPFRANGAFIAALVNAYREGRLVEPRSIHKE